MLKIIPLKEEHLEDAALLVGLRYTTLRKQEPHLPSRYAEVDNLLPLLRNVLNASGAGVAAIRGGQMVGVLTGWQMPSFRGEKALIALNGQMQRNWKIVRTFMKRCTAILLMFGLQTSILPITSACFPMTPMP